MDYTAGTITIAGVTISPTSHDFGTVLTTNSAAQTFTVTNSGVTGGVTLGTPFAGFATGTDLAFAGSGATPCSDGLALADGDSCTFDVTWSPVAPGNLSDTVTVNTVAANNPQASLTGVAVVNDAELNVTNGTISSTQAAGGGVVNIGAFTINNNADPAVTEDLTFTNCALTGDAAIGYAGTTLATLDALTIAVGATLDTPQFTCDTAAAGTFTANLTCDTSDNDNAVGVTIGSITCTVTAAQLDATPAPGSTINLGQVQLGTATPPTAGIDIGNSAGSSPLEITAIALTTNTDITIVSSPALPWTINAGTAQDGTNDIVVQCDPAADGLVTDTLTVTSNDGSGPHTWTVQCEGVSSGVPTVNPPDGGTVTVGPNVGTTTASIVITNDGNQDFTIDNCTFDPSLVAPAAYNCVLTTALPATVAANGGSQTLGVQCDLVEGDNLSVANGLSCDLLGDFDGDPANDPETQPVAWTVNLVGAVYVIPALNPFGLLLMALALMVAGGVMVRRHA